MVKNNEYTLIILDIMMPGNVGLNTFKSYNVLTAKEDKDALRMIEEDDKIDLIIFDVMMPELNGYQVCPEICKNFSLYK